jgi:hypothetical protein
VRTEFYILIFLQIEAKGYSEAIVSDSLFHLPE